MPDPPQLEISQKGVPDVDTKRKNKTKSWSLPPPPTPPRWSNELQTISLGSPSKQGCQIFKSAKTDQTTPYCKQAQVLKKMLQGLPFKSGFLMHVYQRIWLINP